MFTYGALTSDSVATGRHIFNSATITIETRLDIVQHLESCVLIPSDSKASSIHACRWDGEHVSNKFFRYLDEVLKSFGCKQYECVWGEVYALHNTRHFAPEYPNIPAPSFDRRSAPSSRYAYQDWRIRTVKCRSFGSSTSRGFL